MQEYANCFSNTGTQIPRLPPHPEGESMVGFLNPLLNKKLPETQCCVQEEILRQVWGPAVDFHLFADIRSSIQDPPDLALLSNPSSAGERRSSIHLTAARLKQIKLIVARIGPLVLQFLKGVINCIPVVCCLLFFFFLFWRAVEDRVMWVESEVLCGLGPGWESSFS